MVKNQTSEVKPKPKSLGQQHNNQIKSFYILQRAGDGATGSLAIRTPFGEVNLSSKAGAGQGRETEERQQRFASKRSLTSLSLFRHHPPVLHNPIFEQSDPEFFRILLRILWRKATLVKFFG